MRGACANYSCFLRVQAVHKHRYESLITALRPRRSLGQVSPAFRTASCAQATRSTSCLHPEPRNMTSVGRGIHNPFMVCSNNLIEGRAILTATWAAEVLRREISAAPCGLKQYIYFM